jgi:hypothetical protein
MRSLFIFTAVATVAFGLEFVVEWIRLGRPGFSDLSWADSNNPKLVDVLSPMARAYNNILAMLIATIGLAIPLTANMHTPKLIDMFLRDRTNQIMLSLCALGAANVLYVDYLVGPHFAPLWAYRIAVFGAVLGWVGLVPYFFYVIRFLDPSNIVARLQEKVTQEVCLAETHQVTAAGAHDDIHERLNEIGTIILKSLDRADRGVALEGTWSLKRILDHYGERKRKMPADWFQVRRKDFVGLSHEAMEFMEAEKTWFEHKVLAQMFLAYQNALAKTPDVISSISDATRIIATHAAQRGDDAALNLAVRFFNNYLREAIKRKDIHAVYDVFYQYRQLACDLRDRPELMREVGHRVHYYCNYAVANGLPLVPLFAGFDLGWLVCRAYECQCPVASELLDDILALKHTAAGEPLLLPVKAKLILGGFLHGKGLQAEEARLRQNLADVPAATLATAQRDLMTLANPTFWEVTDRQVNFEWVPPEQRPHVKAFIETLQAGKNGQPEVA